MRKVELLPTRDCEAGYGVPFFNLPGGAKTPSSVCTPGVCHPGYATGYTMIMQLGVFRGLTLGGRWGLTTLF